MTPETYSKIPSDVEADSEKAPIPLIKRFRHPEFIIFTAVFFIGLISYFTYIGICPSLPNYTNLQCTVMNTTTDQVFQCKTDLGYYTCVQPVNHLRIFPFCGEGPFGNIWTQCTYVEGPVPWGGVWARNAYGLLNTTATCSYVKPYCHKVTSLVNMNCCELKN